MSDEKRTAQPMDSGAPEVSNPILTPLRQRKAYALETLVRETCGLYPELPGEFGDYDGRNTALSVTFDTTVLDEADADQVGSLMRVAEGDSRVAEVLIEEGQIYVRLHSNPRIQDSRESFDLASAYEVMGEDEYFENEDPAIEGGNFGLDSQAGFGTAGFGE